MSYVSPYVSPTPEGWLSSEADRIKYLLDEGVIVSEIARRLVRDGTVHRHNKYASQSSNIQAITIAAIRRLIRIHNWADTTKSDHSSTAAKRVRMLRTDGHSFREIAQIVGLSNKYVCELSDEKPRLGNKNIVFDGVAVTTRCYSLLINEGMKSWNDVRGLRDRKGPAALRRISGLGRTTHDEILDIIDELSLSVVTNPMTVESVDAFAARLAKVFTFPDIEVEALPLTKEDRANRVFRLSLRQRQTITINIPIELVDED